MHVTRRHNGRFCFRSGWLVARVVDACMRHARPRIYLHCGGRQALLRAGKSCSGGSGVADRGVPTSQGHGNAAIDEERAAKLCIWPRGLQPDGVVERCV